MSEITVIVPCYNEEEVLQMFYEEVRQVLDGIRDIKFHILFINDGSSDGTLLLLRQLASLHEEVSYLSLARNFGKEAAMLAGLDYAGGDAVIIMDADLQHPPAMIPEMIGWWKKGYDDVCTKRSSRQDESFLKRNLTFAFYRLLQSVSRFEVQQNVGDFRLLDARCVAALRMMRESQRYTKGLFTWVGYRKKELPYEVQPRAAGHTAWNYLKLCNLAVEGLTSYTTAPLRLTTVVGMAVSMMAILYLCVVFTGAMLYGDPVAGYPTIMSVMLFLGGVQLMSLGIIGEYLGRVFIESKRRPAYLVEEMDGERVIYHLEPPAECRTQKRKCEHAEE